MTDLYRLIRGGAAPRQVSVGLRVLGSFLLVLALAGAAFSADGTETRITTLLPTSTVCKESALNNNWKTIESKVLSIADQFGSNPKKACSLEFSTEPIPEAAQIISAALRLVQVGQQPNTPTFVITVVSIAKDEDWTQDPKKYEDSQGVGIIRSQQATENAVDVWRSESGKAPVFQYTKEQTGKYITLLLYPRKTGSGRNYYPAIGDATNNASRQPRLIIAYTVPQSSISRSPDSQADGRVAMRSPRRFIPPSPNDAQQKNYTPMKVVDGNISSYTAAIYGGLTHVIRQYVGANKVTESHLDAQEPLGQLAWSKKLPSALDEKARLVVNDSGKLTIVSKNRFIVYQLNVANPRQEPSDPLKNETVAGVTAPHALLAAPDGTIYVTGDTDIYALNPDFQMLWRTGIGTSADARMTLSPDGQFVYATGLLPDGNNKKPAMLAINAQTGTTPPSLAFSSETRFFHHPVVVRHPDGADYIYVVANSQNSGVLKTVINDPQGEIGNRIAKLSPLKEETGLFSQPAPDSTAVPAQGDLSAKKLYVVWQEKQSSPLRLVPINGQSGAIENRTVSSMKDSSGDDASVADGSWLWNGANLVMDSGGNVFFWENGRLFGYGPDNKQLFASGLSLPEKAELRFGSDGTLYATYETGALLAIMPQYKLGAQTNANISSPTHLRVDGTVDKNTMLSAGGSVTIGTGFTVNENKTLSISTGVPSTGVANK